MEPDLPKDSSTTRSIRSHEVPRKTKLFFSPAHVYNRPKICRKFNPAHVYNGPRLRGIQNSDDDGSDEYANISLPTLYKFKFNMKTGKAGKEQLSKYYCDYPKINESYMGRKSRYVYTSKANEESKITAIIKNDLHWKTELQLELGENIYGSEVVFVPLRVNMSSAEDDGYLTTFAHDEKKNVSYAYVIDAHKMELSTMIELPRRVPYGFHATFVTEEELHAQKNKELLG